MSQSWLQGFTLECNSQLGNVTATNKQTTIWRNFGGQSPVAGQMRLYARCTKPQVSLIPTLMWEYNKSIIGRAWVLTIQKNHPVGNFRHEHKTIKCEVGVVGITIDYIQISWRDIKGQKNSITSYQSPYFLKLPKRNGANHFIFQLEFPVFPCKW